MQAKRTTIYELAKELDVSIASISRAFDPNSKLKKEKRQLILETAKRYGYTPNKMASRLSMDSIRIGVLNFNYIKAYYAEIIDGIKGAYNDLKDYKVECDLRVLQRGEATMQDAFAVLDEFRKKHYDGVIISGIFEDCIVEQIDKLVDAGVQVATLQYDIGQSKRLFSSLSNYRMIGEMAARLCGMLLRNSPCKAAVMFTGKKQSPTHQLLVRSFWAASEENGFDIVDIYDTQDNAEFAEKLVKQAFLEHPEISAIYASSANSLPICRYLERIENGKDIAFVASDVFAELYPYIEQGYIDATIYQQPYKMGYDAFDRMYQVLANGIPVHENIMSTPTVVLSANLHKYK